MGIADQHGREGGPANAAQARAWYAQAAEAGHADATYNLGTFIEVGTGGPKDVLVAKTLFMMANAGGTTMRVDDLRLAPNEQGPVRALVAALREPGQLRAVLQQRGLAPAAGPAPVVRQAMGGAAAAATTGMGPSAAAAPSGNPPSRPRQRVDDDEDEESDALRGHPGTGVSMHWGHLALMVGIANVVLVIAFFKPGASFRMGLMAFGLVGAVGAWRTTGTWTGRLWPALWWRCWPPSRWWAWRCARCCCSRRCASAVDEGSLRRLGARARRPSGSTRA